MSPRSLSELALHQPEPLTTDTRVEEAVARLLETELPALPVVDDRRHYAGIFGEREFLNALFPGYLGQLRHAAFVRRSLDAALEKRDACRAEPVSRYMNTEHVEVGPDFSDAQIAEIFFHHRVLIVPVVAAHAVVGVVTRRDFSRALAERFLHPDRA